MLEMEPILGIILPLKYPPALKVHKDTRHESEQADWFDLTIGVEQDAGDDLPIFAIQVLGSQQCTTTDRFNWNILRFIFLNYECAHTHA